VQCAGCALHGKMTQPDNSPAALHLVAVASSAGGLNALSQVFSELPADFPAAVVVVQHLEPHHRSLLAQILARRSELRVEEARDGAMLAAGVVYIAPPDRHLLVNAGGTLSLTRSELVHFVRPSADLLFESVAASHGERAIGVVLTGSGSDGALGVSAMKSTGGTVIAQDKASAEYFGMPGSAIDTGDVDLVLPLERIAPTLVSLVRRHVGHPG
jgi:two-component system, chemotaxis family, protein-glutamate methylesterase/glutaminase